MKIQHVCEISGLGTHVALAKVCNVENKYKKISWKLAKFVFLNGALVVIGANYFINSAGILQNCESQRSMVKLRECEKTTKVWKNLSCGFDVYWVTIKSKNEKISPNFVAFLQYLSKLYLREK